MKKGLKIIGNITRYIIGGFFVLMSIASLNAGHSIHFIRALGFGILLFPVFYKTINEKKLYKPKWEVLFPIIWFRKFLDLLQLKTKYL